MCPHGGTATALPAQSRVVAAGAPATTEADVWTVTGCAFTTKPCTTIRFISPSGRIRVNGSPALLQSSTALCLDAEGSPQGPPHVTVVQQRVVGR
jgi:hypothetical protein